MYFGKSVGKQAVADIAGVGIQIEGTSVALLLANI